MQLSDSPVKVALPFANNAGGPFTRQVPIPSQVGIESGAASFTDGFPPDCFDPISAGGEPPFGKDFNGLLNQMSAGIRWLQAGAPLFYDATWIATSGGYPKGSTLSSTVVVGKQWISLVESNITNPDDPLTSTNWRDAILPSGTPVPFLTATLPADYLPANGLTIGNAASNGTGLASASALFLFAANWFQFSNTQCPILTSAGAPSTRGANPYADFAANKQLTLPNMKGLGLIGVDTMGGAASTFLTSVPVNIGNATTPGSILGENLHALTGAENGIHAHSNILTDPGHLHGSNSPGAPTVGVQGGGTFPAVNIGITSQNTTTASTGVSLNNVTSGSGTAHNTVERNMTVFWGQKL